MLVNWIDFLTSEDVTRFRYYSFWNTIIPELRFYLDIFNIPQVVWCTSTLVAWNYYIVPVSQVHYYY
jgi:hypothetical protein